MCLYSYIPKLLKKLKIIAPVKLAYHQGIEFVSKLTIPLNISAVGKQTKAENVKLIGLHSVLRALMITLIETVLSSVYVDQLLSNSKRKGT